MINKKFFNTSMAGMLALSLVLTGCSGDKKEKADSVKPEDVSSSQVEDSESKVSESENRTDESVQDESLITDGASAVDAAEAFLEAYKGHDIDAAGNLATEEVMTKIGFAGQESLANNLLEKLGYANTENQVLKDLVNDFESKINEGLIRDYVVEGYEDGENGSVIVKAKITHGPGAESIAKINLSSFVETFSGTFMTEHLDTIKEMYETKTQDEIKEYIVEKILPSIFEKVESEIALFDSIVYDAAITVSKTETGEWSITDIVETPVSTEAVD